MSKEYNCAVCKETFVNVWSHEEAQKEFEAAPYYIKEDAKASVCDDCFKKVKAWTDSLTPEQHKAMHDEFYNGLKNG